MLGQPGLRDETLLPGRSGVGDAVPVVHLSVGDGGLLEMGAVGDANRADDQGVACRRPGSEGPGGEEGRQSGDSAYVLQSCTRLPGPGR